MFGFGGAQGIVEIGVLALEDFYFVGGAFLVGHALSAVSVDFLGELLQNVFVLASLLLILSGFAQESFLLILNLLQLPQQILLIHHRLPPILLHLGLDLRNLLLIQIGLPRKFPQLPLPLGILILQILDPSDSGLEFPFILIELTLQLCIGLFALLDFPSDVLLQGEALPALSLDRLFELSDLVFVEIGLPGQCSMYLLQIAILLILGLEFLFVLLELPPRPLLQPHTLPLLPLKLRSYPLHLLRRDPRGQLPPRQLPNLILQLRIRRFESLTLPLKILQNLIGLTIVTVELLELLGCLGFL